MLQALKYAFTSSAVSRIGIAATPAILANSLQSLFTREMSSYKYIVLGGGNASGYAAWEFVKQGVAPGELLIITDEAVVAYERPALSKAYLFPTGAPRLPGFHTCVGGGGERQEPSWYADKGIEYKVNTKIVAADLKAKTLTSEAGDTFTYEKLVVATGARPLTLTDFKTPGADLPGAYYLRDVKDADLLIEGIAKAKAAGNKAVVVGGGYIGLETAAALNLNGLDVTLVFPEPHIMPRLFTPTLAEYYTKFYEAKGVKFLVGELVTALEGDGKVETAVLKSGAKLPADIVVVGVGARANWELFKDQLELTAGGIKVDGKFQTSDPDVYAIGDVAAFPILMNEGQILRQEHVTNARSSAAHAVKAIYGATEDYDYLPFFYSRVFNLAWQFYGLSDGTPVAFGDFENGKFGTYWVKDGTVRGAFLESGTNEENAAIKQLALTRPAAPADEELASLGISFALSKI